MLEWSEFARRLGRELTALERDTILIVREREESRHYVQAMREPDRLYAEAVSNNFLDGPLLLTLADEEVMSESGWRPPAEPGAAGPRNWWTELPGFATPADYARLAEVMVTALRDVQAVRRPSDLVYESFHRHGTGLVGLPELGLECADPSRITRTRGVDPLSASGQGSFPEPDVLAAEPGMPPPPAFPDAKGLSGPAPNGLPGAPGPLQGPGGAAFPGYGDVPGQGPSVHDVQAGLAPAAAPVPMGSPADEIEPRLAEAKDRGDHTTYFDLLPTADLVFPDAPGESVPPTMTLGAVTYITVFTSPGALARVSSPAVPFRRTSFADLSANWPDPAWQLAINPGLGSEIHLDLTAVARLGAVRPGSSTPVPPPSGGVSVPPPMSASPGLPDVPSVQPGAADAVGAVGLHGASAFPESEDETRLDLTAIDPHGRHDQVGAPSAPLGPEPYAPSSGPASYEESGLPGPLAGHDPSATPQMPGLPVERDQLAASASGSVGGGSVDAQSEMPPHLRLRQYEISMPGVPAPRDASGTSSAGEAVTPMPQMNAQDDGFGASHSPGPYDALSANGPVEAQPSVPGPQDAQHDALAPQSSPAPHEAFATQGAAEMWPGASGQAEPHSQRDEYLPTDGVGASVFPVPDGLGGPSHGDVLGAPRQHDGIAVPDGSGQTDSLASPEASGAPERQDAFGMTDSVGALPETVAHACGQDGDAADAPAQYEAAGQDSSGTTWPPEADAGAVGAASGRPAFGSSGASSLRDAFAGAAAGRRDSGARGFQESDTSGMPVLPGLEAHGTAAMPAAAPVPDSGVAETAHVVGTGATPGSDPVAEQIPDAASSAGPGAGQIPDAAPRSEARLGQVPDTAPGSGPRVAQIPEAGPGTGPVVGQVPDAVPGSSPIVDALPGSGPRVGQGSDAVQGLEFVPGAAAVRGADAALMRVPHGTALWETDGTGDGAPVAVFDSVGGVWTPVRADALPTQLGE
ncbi:hypothetical protein AB0J52_20450 [Spirillospora sp. NPDC049652]